MVKSKHSTHEIKFHLVFCTKYRNKILTPIRTIIAKHIRHKFVEFKADIISLSVQDDHVHIFFQASPTQRLDQLIGMLKSHVTKNTLDDLPYFNTQKDRTLWSRGYFLASCGIDDQTIIQYIKNQ